MDLEGLLLTMHPFDDEFAVGSLGGLIQQCDLRTGRVMRELTANGHDAQITALRYSHGGSSSVLLVGVAQQTLTAWLALATSRRRAPDCLWLRCGPSRCVGFVHWAASVEAS